MKKLLTLVLALAMLLGCAASASAETVINPDELSYPVGTPANKANNPVIEGEHPFTGLKAETDEELDALEHYTPILVVYDNNAEGYMHTGVGDADIIFQVPNMSTGNNKLLVLFASRFPEYAGGTRSGRITVLPFALALDTAFVSAGFGPPDDVEDPIVGDNVRKEWGFKLDSKYFSTISGRPYKHRVTDQGLPSQANLMAHVREIRDNYLIAQNVEFEKRPFLFTDEPLTRGEIANVIDMKFYESPKDSKSNENSDCTFRYEEGMGYTRDILMGTEFDRDTQEFLYFSNVIVMRVEILSQEVLGTGYKYYKNHLVGSGKADIFQNGRYIRGAWYRENRTSRLIFLDDEGNELQFQRGKSYIVVNSSNCVVTYDE